MIVQGPVQIPAFFFSTVPMPSKNLGNPSTGLAQRPQFNSDTNVLSWQGPVGGGPSNGFYVPQTRVLTKVSAITSTADNQIIEGLYVNDNLPTHLIQINHNNVTIRQCAVQCAAFDAVAGDMIFVAFDSGTGKTKSGTIVEDCFIDGNANSNEVNGVTGATTSGAGNPGITDFTVRRNYGLRLGQLVRNILNGSSSSSVSKILENYSESFSGIDADDIEIYPTGGVCNHLLIQYNYFIGPDNAAGGANSGVNLSTGAGLAGGTIGPDVVVDTNWFVWPSLPENVAWQSHSINNAVGGAIGGNQEILEFTCTNNGIFNISPNGYGSGGTTLLGTASSATSTTNPGGGLVHDSGNYIMATTTSRTGSPYVGGNGSGRL